MTSHIVEKFQLLVFVRRCAGMNLFVQGQCRPVRLHETRPGLGTGRFERQIPDSRKRVDFEFVVAGSSTSHVHAPFAWLDDKCEYGYPESSDGIIVSVTADRLRVPVVIA